MAASELNTIGKDLSVSLSHIRHAFESVRHRTKMYARDLTQIPW